MPITSNTHIETLAASGGTITWSVSSLAALYIVKGTATLTSSLTITSSGVATAGMQYNIKYEAVITLGSNSITIFGATMPAELVNKTCIINCYYDGTDWEVNFLPDVLEANVIPYTSINLPLATAIETYSIPLSFETGEQGFQRVFLNRNGGPFAVKSLNLVTTKLIEATNSGYVTFHTVGGAQLDTLRGGSTGMEVIGGTVAGDSWVTTGNTAPDNNLLVTAFAAPTEIKVKTLKATVGGKCTLYITIEKL